MRKKSTVKEFVSSDFYLCAFLLCSGLKLLTTRQENPKKLLFVFEDAPDRTDLVGSYFANRAKVDPLAYKTRIGDMKAMLYNSGLK